MIKLLKCEFLKTRRRYIFLTALVITAFALVWGLHGTYNDFIIKNGWMEFLYQLPLVNAIFFPLLAIITSSRLCDIEHKGVMLKLLEAVCDKGKIYDAKLLYGLAIMVFCNILSWAVQIIFGCYMGFEGALPIKLYLIYLLFTIAPSTAVYIFQHVMSLLFKNQAVTFFTGVIGTFGGLFSMFLPQLPWFRRSLIWGYYGALQFVGMFGWEPDTRFEHVYFECMGIDWLSFAVIAITAVIIYITGKILFCRKEV